MSHYTVTEHLDVVRKALSSGGLTKREKGHAEAVLALAGGSLPKATQHWASILVDYPRDLQAIHIVTLSFITLGEFEKQRNCLAQVLPHWNIGFAAYPFILGL